MSDNDQTIHDFIALFTGRTDAYGSWTGGKIDSPHEDPVQGNAYTFYCHLHHGPFYGVYPQTDDSTVGWGCIDIDGKDFIDFTRGVVGGPPVPDWTEMWRIAALLQDVLAYKDCTSWLERTANGIHVWVFADERVPAAIMRRALLVACDVAEYKPKEVNPKQETVDPSKPYGNYVRLPYYGALVNGTPKDRFVVDEDGLPMDVHQFSRTAMGSRTPVGILEDMATMYAPPPTITSVNFDQATEDAFRLLEPILPPVVELIFQDGPLDGRRGKAYVKVAVPLRDDGWTPQAIYTVVKALDSRLGKFVDRPDREDYLLGVLESAGVHEHVAKRQAQQDRWDEPF